MTKSKNLLDVYLGEHLARYGFDQGHPFSLARHDAFSEEFYHENLFQSVNLKKPVLSEPSTIELFHEKEYVDFVKNRSIHGGGYLDRGDTPAFKGVFEAASFVVGSALDGVESIMSNQCRRVFVPIGGLHHARREGAAGFCVFNDCGVAIEYLFKKYHLQRIAYVDIDAHHGDGVYYGFESNPGLIFADIHESGRTLYPGTGFAHEKGKNEAEGKKLNIEMEMGASDNDFFAAWSKVENFIVRHEPQFIIFQCGADSIAGDPLTHLNYSPEAHKFAAKQLKSIAEDYCEGRVLALGGGGYNLNNIKKAWTSVVKSLI